MTFRLGHKTITLYYTSCVNSLSISNKIFDDTNFKEILNFRDTKSVVKNLFFSII